MSKRIQDTPFADLLPESIRHDSGIAAAATAFDPALRQLVLGVPNLLLFSRLGPVNSLGVADASGSELIATRRVRQIHSAEHLSAAGAGKVPTPGRLSPPLQRLTDAAGGLRPLSEAELELLAWQFHVDFRDAAGTPEQLAEMVRQSIPWHRIKGTPAAVRLAVGMLFLPPSGTTAGRAAGATQLPRQLQATASVAQDVRPSEIVIEEDGRGEDWATFQLGFDAALTPEDIPRLLTLVNLSKPVRCRLRRIYSGYDIRPLILDRHFGLDRNYLDGESGIFYPEHDLVVSFGYRVRSQTLPEDRTPFMTWTEFCSCIVDYLKTYQLDRFRLDIPLLQPPQINAAHIEAAEIEATDHSHDLSLHRAVARAVSKSQLALDWTKLDGVNARLDRPHIVRVGNPVRLDRYRLDASIDRRVIPIHELFHELICHAATERTAFNALAQGMELFSGEVFFDLHNPRHRGQQLDNVLLDSPRRERFGLADGRLQADFAPEPLRWFDTAYPSREISRSQFAVDACRLDGDARFDGPHVTEISNPVRLDRYRLDAGIGKNTRPLPYLRVELARMGVAARAETAPLWAETGLVPVAVPVEARQPQQAADELSFAAPRNLPRFPRVDALQMDGSPLDSNWLHGNPFAAVASLGGAENAPLLAERGDVDAPQLAASQVDGLGDTERVPPALWASGWTNRPWIEHFAYLLAIPQENETGLPPSRERRSGDTE